MVKSYFLTYGISNVDVDKFGKHIAHVLGMKYELRESLYTGQYVNCIGLQADTLRIVPGKVAGELELAYKQFPEYDVFVEISNIQGKNVDKEARTLSIKQVLATIPELVLVKEIVHVK